MPEGNTMQFRAEIHGLAELDRALASLEVETSTKALRNAMMYATTPLLKEMKERAPANSPSVKRSSKYPDGVGTLKDSIRRKSFSDKAGANRKNAATVKVGAMSGGNKGYSWYKAVWVEFGYHAVGTSKRSKRSSAGRWMPPKPFMRQAMDSQKNNIVDRFSEKLRKNLQRLGRV